MSKLTVKEYADIHKVSVQSLYKKIKENKLECQEIKGIKYIIINDEIDYEKKFNELQLKYDSLIDRFELQKDMIRLLKREAKYFYNILPKPKKKDSEEFKEIKLKKKKKKKKK